MQDGLILSQSEYEYLLEEIHKLQARITELTALRDDLVYHVCPALQAEYDEKIVSLERELMAANMYLKQMQRSIEILQAQMNQQQEPSMEEAEAQAKRENKEFEDDLNRKAEEAREFKKKWEESQWSKHDRQEKESREREEEEKERAKDKNAQEEQTAEDNGGGAGKEDQDSRNADRSRDGWENEGSGNHDSGGPENEGSGDQESGGYERQNRSGSSAGETDGENDFAGKSGKEETTADKIKRLYRKIVKRLHPDVHPNLTEHEKELWNRAVKAQQEGDYAQLEKIWDELSGMDAPEDVYDDTPEGRGKLRELLEKLKVRLRLLELEIDHIKSGFPYNKKAFLEDPIAVEEVRRGIQSKIDHVREMNRQLEAFINELREKLRKGEKL